MHPAAHLDRLEETCAVGGHFDADTPASPESWIAALTAAGAGLAAADALAHGDGEGAFLAVRPPGHHARRAQAMGFCLVNNVAVLAADLRARGDRVAVVDIDAHHGNGTQEIFYSDPDVLYVSLHEWPLYPGTGRHDETGAGAGRARPATSPSRRGRPATSTSEPSTTSSSRSSRASPRTGCSSRPASTRTATTPSPASGSRPATTRELFRRLLAIAPAGRTITFLEGGYSLSGLRDSVAASVPVLAGGDGEVPEGEEPTSGGPGEKMVRAAASSGTPGTERAPGPPPCGPLLLQPRRTSADMPR